jgi:enterochelin esterase-like enzyme
MNSALPRTTAACFLCLLMVAPVAAQAPGVPVLVSPEVLADRRIIVRFYAPQAREVRIFFERGGDSLKKGEDGVWQATLGPLDPGAYRYGFTVDGASVTDPRNIETERMQVVTRSILYVPGAAFMDETKVPHGAVGVVNYYSSALKKFRRFHLYTPPGYEANQEKYPVLYLLHGANESDESWSVMGRAAFLLDNLIAERRAVPMIVVMPNGHIDQTPPNVAWGVSTSGPLKGELVDFVNEFAADIMPYIDSHYRTIADRSHRAIAGLSMGGTQTLNIAFGNLDRFSALGVFSSGILVGSLEEWEKDHRSVLDDARLKKGLKTIWFSTGSSDPFINNSRAAVEMLKKHGFAPSFEETAGSHSWVNWRNYLHEFVPQLFR